MDDVVLNQKVFIDKACRVGVVGVDAAYFGGGHVNLGGLFLGKEGLHGGLVGKVQLGVGAGDKVGLRRRFFLLLCPLLYPRPQPLPYVSSNRTMSSSPR